MGGIAKLSSILLKFCISVISKGWLRDGKWLAQKDTVRYMSCMGIWGLNSQSTGLFSFLMPPALSYCVTIHPTHRRPWEEISNLIWAPIP